MMPAQLDPFPADEPRRAGGSRCLMILAQFPRIFLIILAISLSGCSFLQSREGLIACTALDVGSTVYGVSSGKLIELNPLWKASVNAGHYLPFVLGAVALVWLVDRYASPEVTGVVSGVECGLGARNVFLMR